MRCSSVYVIGQDLASRRGIEYPSISIGLLILKKDSERSPSHYGVRCSLPEKIVVRVRNESPRSAPPDSPAGCSAGAAGQGVLAPRPYTGPAGETRRCLGVLRRCASERFRLTHSEPSPRSFRGDIEHRRVRGAGPRRVHPRSKPAPKWGKNGLIPLQLVGILARKKGAQKGSKSNSGEVFGGVMGQ